MKRPLLAVALATAACTALVACQRPASEASAPAPAAPAATAEATTTPAATAVPTDLDQLAQRVVTQSAGVKEGDIVLINGQAHDA
jgi:hypothetical protein